MATALKHVPAEKLSLAQVGNGYIELRDHRFAAVYKVSKGINFTIDENGEIDKRLSIFENALRQLAPNEEIQIIFKRVPAESNALIDQFRKYASDKAPVILQDKFYGYYESWIDDFTQGRLSGTPLFEYEVYVLFSIDFNLKPLTEHAFGLLNKIFTAGHANKIEEATDNIAVLSQQLEEVRRRGKTWINNLSVSGVAGRELSKHEIYLFLYSEINLTEFKGSTSGFDKAALFSAGVHGLQTIREALSTQPIKENKNSIEIGDKFVRTINITNFPERGQSLAFLNQFLYQRDLFKITLFVRGIDQEFGKTIIKGQMRHDLGAGSDGTLPQYDAAANINTRNAVLSSISRGETGLARMSLYVSVFADSEKELKNRYENFVARFNGIHIYNGYFQQEKFFYSALPLCTNLCKEEAEVLQTTRDISNCWPFFYDSLTTDKGVIMGYTNSSEPFMLDPWLPANDNYNIGIFGMPGTGKSFLIQLLLNRLMPKCPDVMIIDRSGTYATSCMAAGGEYILFDLKTDKHINVFDTPDESYQSKGTISEDQQEAVAGFLTTILVETGESSLKNAEASILLDAIKKTYRGKFETEKERLKNELEKAVIQIKPPLLRDFRAVVMAMSKEKDASNNAREFTANAAEILMSYVDDGTYANLTDKETNVNRNNKFLVFDTSLGQKNVKIKILTTYIVSTFCFNRAREIQKRSGFPIIVIDEFWDLLSFAAGRAFAELLSRTSRHLSLCTIFATQMIGDCMRNEQAKTALNVASTKIFLKLGDADRVLCAEAFQLGSKELGIISNLQQIKGRYSMGFLKSTPRQGLIYITPDPVTNWISTSFPEDKIRRNKYFEYYNPGKTVDGCWTAIFRLVNDQMYGIEPEFLKN